MGTIVQSKPPKGWVAIEPEESLSIDSALFFGVDLSIKLFAPRSIQQSAQDLYQEKHLFLPSHNYTLPNCPNLPDVELKSPPKPEQHVEVPAQEADKTVPAPDPLNEPPAAPIIPPLLEDESIEKPAVDALPDLALNAALKSIEEEKGAKLDEDISNLNDKLKALKKDFDKDMDPWKEYESAQDLVILYAKYAHANRDNIKEGINLFVSSELYDRIDNLIDVVDNASYKCGIPSIGLLFNYFKLKFSNAHKNTLKDLKERYYELNEQVKEANFKTKILLDPSTKFGHSDNSMAHLKDRLDAIGAEIHQIEQDEAYATPKNRLKFAASVIPLALVAAFANLSKKKANKWCKEIYNIIKCCSEISDIFEGFKLQNEWLYRLKPKIFIDKTHSEERTKTDQEILQKDVGGLLETLEECDSLEELSEILSSYNISIPLPELFVEWKEQFKTTAYKRELIQTYYYSNNLKVFMTSDNIDTLLDKRKSEFSQKVEKSVDSMIIEIAKCANKTTLEEISKHFVQFNVYLDRLNPPLKSKEEWDQKTNDLNFQKSLATQWVGYQETTALLAEQSLRQLLLCQNNRERKFLIFNGFESCIHISTSIAKMGLTLVNSSLNTFTKGLSFAVHDLTEVHPCIGLISLIYPEWTIKVVTLVMAGIRFLVGSFYKPNEYSFEGYKIGLEIRWMEFVLAIHNLISFAEKALLWINIRLIENIVLQSETDGPYENDPRYIQIDEKLKERKNCCKHQINILKDRLHDLRTMDNNINFFPDAGQRDDEVKANGYVNAKQVDCRSLNHVEVLADALQKGNFDFWPDSARQFIGSELGIELTDKNKEQIIEALRTKFLKDELDFIDTFAASRASLIKV